ncbi:acyl transferase domain-containing protein [Ustulina deusta]|nr:acyl transferase domain-containing protein [Ustulina deusta]
MIVSNRISHVFNLQGPRFEIPSALQYGGPSMTLDTACSSSMYAFHLAVSAINAGECDAAIVAGANLIQSPEQHYLIHKAGVLSPTSACHTFNAFADGYGRADEINAVYIKRLSHALENNDHIWAVVRATAVNADGRTPGITQPNSDSQSAVIRKAYKKAGLSVEDADYFECHGTGTAVGDPTEIDGISQVFASREGCPLLIGSAKTNFGHSEAAAGLTSLIKVALAFEYGRIPPTYGVTEVNPSLRLGSRNMEVVVNTRAWPRRIQRSSINSFGYGGANAHTILESLESYLARQPNGLPSSPKLMGRVVVLPISSASLKSLGARVASIRNLAFDCSARMLERIAFTLTSRRTHFPARDYILVRVNANDSTEFIPTELISRTLGTQLPFAFVFTGQGAQYNGMARELLQHNGTFLTTIRELDAVLKSLPFSTSPIWSLEQLLESENKDGGDVHDPRCSQSLCTAVQIGLVNVLRSWGITPTAVVGHSSGEIAAAYASGFIDGTQAILVAYFRGLVVSYLNGEGTMMAAKLDVAAALGLIKSHGLGDQVCVACVNSPESVTLSGSSAGIDVLFRALQSQDTFVRKLLTGNKAYHSYMMSEVGQLYEDLITPLFASPTPKKSAAHMFSSVGDYGAQLIDPRESTAWAKYWRSNLEKPVQFQAALTKLITRGHAHLIEIGPHHALLGPVKQTLAVMGLNETT